ncbi:hypothetical protein [Streptomyces sp. SLBN-31]|uniref:hypothetical protein n=1 Tax=Streptomyces sp. SLBN-31 TaxID=2768444 RepID=UPI001150F867|nr:hypothetical protein [Streptomyces sp. SLBN-31]TQJ75292.1 hypothetical protein FBY22_8331 [Streptomyces sp. SLBN-31]
MPRTPTRLLTTAPLLTAAALLTATACTAGTPQARKPPVAPTKPSATGSAPAPRALTEAQAQAALVTATDLGEPWAPTQGAATWRDGLLKATTESPECRRLLDALYADDLFGGNTGTRAVTGLDDPLDQAQLRYQVLALNTSDVDRTLTWLKSLPRGCGTFTAVTAHGAVQGVTVREADLPQVGDARQGLRVTLSGETADGDPTVLTMDVAAVRVGDDTIAVSLGGLGDVSPDATRAAVETGVRRLTEIRKSGRAQI